MRIYAIYFINKFGNHNTMDNYQGKYKLQNKFRKWNKLPEELKIVKKEKKKVPHTELVFHQN